MHICVKCGEILDIKELEMNGELYGDNGNKYICPDCYEQFSDEV